MEIIDAYWTPNINMLVIKCKCGVNVIHRADRWRIVCGKCGATDDLGRVRDRPFKRFNVNKNSGEKKQVIKGLSQRKLGKLHKD